MRTLSVLLAGLIALPGSPAIFAQEAVHKLSLVVIEGDGAINNIRQRTAREPIVQVEDENHKPVAGAAVLFLLPQHGAGGTFADGSHSLTVVTDSQGRAAARGIHLNSTKGQYEIQVTATLGSLAAAAIITQTTVAAGAAGAGTAAHSGILSTKAIVIIAVVAAAAAGGAYWATHSGGGSGTPVTPGTTITAGGGSVSGPPH